MAVNGNRITLKRTRPNPLFQDWLEELHEEANLKKSKFKNMIKEALNSLTKYPLPLQSGEECAILKGFNTKLCLFLDKRLEEYESSYKCNNSSSKTELATGLSEKSIIDVNNVSEVNMQPEKPEENLKLISEIKTSKNTKTVSCDTVDLCQQQYEPEVHVLQSDIEITEIFLPGCNPQSYHTNLDSDEISIDSIETSSQGVKKKKLKYKPLYRSACYSILMALMEHKSLNSTQAIGKTDLVQLAHKYSENSMKTPTDDTRDYLANNIVKLLSRDLLIRTGGDEPTYQLTDLGYATAMELYEDTILKQKPDETKTKHLSVSQEENDGSEIDIPNDPRVEINQFITNIEEYIEFDAGSFDIVLLIDINESLGLSKMNDPIMVQIKKYPKLKHEYRCLSVGDFMWIARHKTTKQELVLPYIIERKRMDDLAASIKDGRFHEQKFRLKKSDANIIYMVENYDNNKNVGLPMTTLMQGLVNTRVQDGFKVHITGSLVGSVRFLAILTMRLIMEYQNSRLKGHNKKAEGDMLMTYDFFNKFFMKNKPLSVKYTFIKLLLQLKGISVGRALAITKKYKTPKLLLKAYENCEKREGETLLAQLRTENNRTVGATISKTIYQLFTSKELS